MKTTVFTLMIVDGLLSLGYLVFSDTHSLSWSHNLLLILSGIFFSLSMNQLSRTANLRSRQISKYLAPNALFPLLIVLWEILVFKI